MLYSLGNNSCNQSGFESNKTSNRFFGEYISQLNDKKIVEISLF